MFVAAWRQTTPMAASRNATRSNIRELFHATACPSATPTREATKLCRGRSLPPTVLLADSARSRPRSHSVARTASRYKNVDDSEGLLPLRRHSHPGEPHAPGGPHRAHDSGQEDERHQDNHDALEQRIRTGPEGGVEQHEAVQLTPTRIEAATRHRIPDIDGLPCMRLPPEYR